ncbi:MAG: hypothetical protein P8L44_08620 [Opitutales bacterium]|nr:hypothetical protein [Opitutales bacterium]
MPIRDELPIELIVFKQEIVDGMSLSPFSAMSEGIHPGSYL